MTLTTALHAEHVAAGAKLVDFAGWDMPLHYGSQLAEHREVRTGAGMFDVSHMGCVDISGPQATDWLQHLLANDVGRLDPDQALYSGMLNEAGGVIDDLITYRCGAGSARRRTGRAGRGGGQRRGCGRAGRARWLSLGARR